MGLFYQCCGRETRLAFGNQSARKKLIVLLFVEPRAFNVEEFEARHADRERERIDRELRDGFIRACIGLVIENVHGVVAHLQKVEVAGDASFVAFDARGKLDPVPRFKLGDLGIGEPDRNFDGDGAGIIREHKVLQRLVPQLVATHRGNDEGGGLGRGVFFAVDDEARDVSEGGMRLRGAGLRIVVAAKQVVRACCWDAFQKRGEGRKAPVLRIAMQERELRAVIREGVDLAMVELDRADRLRGRIHRFRFGTQPAESCVLLVRADPGRDGGRGDAAAGFGFQALCCFGE